MSILTDKELNEKKEGSKQTPPSIDKKTTAKSDKKPAVEYECGWAPAGKSSTCFEHMYEGKLYKFDIELNNKRYKVPSGMKADELKALREVLLLNGFKDVTVCQKAQVFDKVKAKYIYRAVHPEHASKNRINGNLSLVLQNDEGQPMYNDKGEQITKQVTIVEGVVTTDDEMVYEALLKAGFVNAGKAEKK